MDLSSTDRPEVRGDAISGTIALAAPQGRASKRIEVALDAGLRQRGAHRVPVQITDLSTHGFRAETHLVLREGADVWVRLPGLENTHARVAWVKGFVVGCAFAKPLHPAVLELVIGRSHAS